MYPTLPVSASREETVITFRGYNHNPRIGSGEFYDMENLTSDLYPLLSPRKSRGFYAAGAGISGLTAKDQLCYTDGSAIFIGQEKVDLGLSPGDKRLISLGAYILIFPDKMYINTLDLTDRGSLEAAVTAEGAQACMCDLSGAPLENVTVGASVPEDVTLLWLDTAAGALKQYSVSTGQWVAQTPYVKFSAPGLGAPFAAGDGVELSGLEGTAAAELEGTAVILSRGEDYIVITGILEESLTLSAPLTLERRVPELDLCIPSGNRLWGCRYGKDRKGNTVNEIYASKLGDFKNWACFQGISTDSYRAECGADGAFTGAIDHLGYPLFFKEGYLLKIWGSEPASFRVQATPCRGVQRGSEGSLAIVGETLYYKSRLGVCAYDGSLPTQISACLGQVPYSAAVAGAHGSKYFISMADQEGRYHLFVYDVERRLWHREDNTQAAAFASFGSDLYYLDRADGRIKTILGSGAKTDEVVSWMAQTGLLGVTGKGTTYISRLTLRLQLGLGSSLSVYIEYDSQGRWQHLRTLRGTSLNSFDLPIRPNRCDHFRLRLEGKGEARIFSMSRVWTKGRGL